MKFTEEEMRTIKAVFDELHKMPFSDLNKVWGSMTCEEIGRLANKLYYNDYCERHGITYEDMTEGDFIDAYRERYEC